MRKTIISVAPYSYAAPQAEPLSVELAQVLMQSGLTEDITDDDLTYGWGAES